LGRGADGARDERAVPVSLLSARERPTDPEGGSRKDTGHTLICGPTGSGKTVFIGFLVAMLSRQGATQVVFDKDRGLEILIRALGGEYCPLKNGQATGFNPLKLPPTALNVEFLKSWLRVLVRPPASGAPLSVRQQADLDQALRERWHWNFGHVGCHA